MCDADVVLSLYMCDTDFDMILGGGTLCDSCDMMCYMSPHVSYHGMRCLQYIPLARL